MRLTTTSQKRQKPRNWTYTMKPALIQRMRVTLTVLIASASLAAPVRSPATGPGQVLELWNGSPPGEKGELGPEHDTTKPADGLVAGKRVIRLANGFNPPHTL